MTQVISKFNPIYAPCAEVIHPWTKHCFNFWIKSYSHIFVFSIKLYFKIYVLTFLLKRKVPSLQDLKHTLIAILQSSNFIAIQGGAFNFAICNLRYILGYFNILSVAFIPGIFCTIFIFLERQSRRVLLSLYMTNIAIELFWRCLKERNIVKPLPYGATIIFSLSIALLSMYLKDGVHNYIDDNGKRKTDGIFRFLRYILGADEFVNKSPKNESNGITNKISATFYSNFTIYIFYQKMINCLKTYRSHTLCPHSDSCIYSIFAGTLKAATVGAGLEILVTLLGNIQKLCSKPTIIKTILFRNGLLHHTLSITKFVGIFKTVSCILRWITNKDNKYNTLLAGFLAGSAFANYNDNQIAIYIMLKALHITYNLGIRSKTVPEVPYFAEILYIIACSIISQAMLSKPEIVREDYLKYIYHLTGGKSIFFNRKLINQWGFNAHETNDKMKKFFLKYNTI